MIAGGGGLIGRHLSAALLARGDEVLVLSRLAASVQTRLPGCAVLRWHPGSDGKWQDDSPDDRLPPEVPPRRRIQSRREHPAARAHDACDLPQRGQGVGREHYSEYGDCDVHGIVVHREVKEVALAEINLQILGSRTLTSDFKQS